MNASVAWKEKSVTWGAPLRKSFEFWRKCEEERGCGLILACGTDRPTDLIEINVGTKGPRMKWMANPVGIACEPWKWLKWNGARVCEPWKWLKWNGARVWAVKVAQIKWIFWHLKMWGSGEFLLSETMRGFEFECYLGLNACVAWLLSTEYLERFTAILPLENVSLLPATTRDRWQYIRGQMEKKILLSTDQQCLIRKASFIFVGTACPKGTGEQWGPERFCCHLVSTDDLQRTA